MAEKGRKRRRIVSSSRADGITVSTTDERRVYIVDFILDLGGPSPYRFRRVSPFQTKGQSREWGKQHREKLLAGGGKVEKAAPRADPDKPRSFAYWAKRYIEDATNPARRRGKNKPSTLRGKRMVVDGHLVPALGSTRIDKIGDRELEEYVRQKATTLAIGTLLMHEAQLLAVLRLAKAKGSGAERMLELPDYRVPRPKQRPIPDTLSETQTAALFEAFGDAPPWQLAMLALLFRGGLRVGEAQALRWTDIDFGREEISVNKTVSDGGISDTTKGGQDREVPLHWEIREALELMGIGEGWIFPSPERGGEKPRSYRGIVDAIRPRWDECGFTGRDGKPIAWHTHIGRHSLGRHWAERGWPLIGLQRLLGHADLTTTQIYSHWEPSATAPLLQQLGRTKLRVVRGGAG